MAIGLIVLMSRAHADPVTQLIRILGRAGDYKQRLAAVIGLGRCKDRRAVLPLINALGDSHHTVRGTAARVLGTLGDRRAVAPLKALLLGAKNGFVRAQAQQALAALMPQSEDRQPGGQMQVRGTLGTLDQSSIQDGVQDSLPHANACYAQQLAGAPFLGGRVVLKFRVKTDGKVKWVRVKTSDLGSLEAETCIVKEMAAASFDEPDGGEAEFSIPLTFTGGDAVTTLDDRSAAARRLGKSCKKLLRSPAGPLTPPPGLHVGLYIDPDGKVVSAGLSADGAEIPPEFARDFIANLKKLTLADPSVETGHGKLIHRLSCQP